MVIGRKLPNEIDKKPPLYRMRLFAPDEVAAKSKYWYYLKKLRKIKKTNGEVVECKRVGNWVYQQYKSFFSILQIKERFPTKIKNIGIWLRYDSRSGTHNMYREYRDVTVAGGVTQCCKCTMT